MLFQRLWKADKRNINFNSCTCHNIMKKEKGCSVGRKWWCHSLQELLLVKPVCTPVCTPALSWLSVCDRVWRCASVDSLLPRPQSCCPLGSGYYWAMYHFSAVDPGERERSRKSKKGRQNRDVRPFCCSISDWCFMYVLLSLCLLSAVVVIVSPGNFSNP